MEINLQATSESCGEIHLAFRFIYYYFVFPVRNSVLLIFHLKSIIMLVIAHHHITDPDKFWSTAKDVTSSMPSNLKLHSVFPSSDMKTGTCVWEAPSVNEVQKFLDDHVGSYSKNICYEVNQEAAMGVPKMVMEAAL